MIEMHRSAVIVVLVLVTQGFTGRVAAQGGALVPVGSQDLRFGTVLPGFPTVISRLDAVNGGQFQIRGQRRAEVRIDFALPVTLTAGSGATLPLQFGSADGGYSTRPAVGSAQSFDPHIPLVVNLGNSGRIYFFLGGSALPTPLQEAGSYQGTITMTVAYTGV
jgi:hypothetical protein